MHALRMAVDVAWGRREGAIWAARNIQGEVILAVRMISARGPCWMEGWFSQWGAMRFDGGDGTTIRQTARRFLAFQQLRRYRFVGGLAIRSDAISANDHRLHATSPGEVAAVFVSDQGPGILC